MRNVLVLIAVLLAAGACKKKDKATAVVATDAGPTAPTPKYGVVIDGVAAPTLLGQAPVVESLLEVLATRQAALSPAPAAVKEKPIKRGFVADPPIEDAGDFKVVSQSTDESPLHAMMLEYLNGFAGALNEAFKLPRDIPIVMKPCGEPNMFYSPSAQEIYVCDEALPFMISVFQRYRDPDSATLAGLVALIGGFFHELGHCLIHQFELPSTGREEDAADQFATLFLLGGPDIPDDKREVQFALTFSEFWMARDLVRSTDARARAWDKHSPDDVRYYEILCLTYGVSPAAAKFLVDDGDLPAERGQDCPDQYKATHRTWKKLLTPYMQPGVPF